MADPSALGQVVNLSRKSLIPLTNPKHASNGCSKIQIPAQIPAIGHAMNQRRTNHKIAKIGFDAIVNFVSVVLLVSSYCGHAVNAASIKELIL